MGLSNETSWGGRIYVNLSSQEIKEWESVPMWRTGTKGSYEYFKKVSWNYRSVSFADGEFVNKKWQTVKTRDFELILEDEWKDIYVKGNLWSGIGRGIFNLLSSKTELWFIEIEVYVNSQWYYSCSVKDDGEKMEWKLDRPTQDNLITKVEVDGKTVKGYKELNEAIEKNAMLMTPKQSFVDDLLTETNKPTETVADSSDDLPFN